jgi:maltoporin
VKILPWQGIFRREKPANALYDWVSNRLYQPHRSLRFSLTDEGHDASDLVVKTRLFCIGGVLLGSATLAMAQNEAAAELRKELDAIRGDYEKRINQLEARIQEMEATPTPSPKPKTESEQANDIPKSRKRTSKIEDRGPVNQKKSEREIGDTDPESNARNAEMEAKALERAQRQAADEKFEGNTEIRDLAKGLNDENLLADRIEEVLQGYLDISGYFRAGYGHSNEGGPQQAFGIPDLAKYRLGNEAENYGELAFAKTFFPLGVFGGEKGELDGPIARMTYRLSFYNPYDNYGSSQDTQFGSPEVWASVANVIPGMPDAKFWAGDRFYRRHDIHINDFYFWDMSGGGGGVEDVTLGNGKLALAWVGNGAQSGVVNGFDSPDPENEAGFSKTSFDLRYYDWAFFGGTGEVGLIYSSANSGNDVNGLSAPNSDGVAINLVKTDKEFLDKNSLNVMSLQFGTGPASSFTSGFETFSTPTGTFIRPAPEDAWRFRATEQVVIQPIEEFSIGAAMVYQYTDYGLDLPNQQWLSGGLRPIWQISDGFSLAFEGGVDWATSTQGGEGGTLGKLTIAPQVSIGNEFFSRPVLRAFFTYAMWTEGLQGEVGGLDYANQTSGWTWGVQMESWW